MKYKFATLIVLLAFAAPTAWAQQPVTPPAATPPAPAKPAPHLIEFNETTHDFGTQDQGAKTETVFTFKNISDEPVKLTTVKASCGCTTPLWTKEEIAPGGSGEIKVTYNSNRIGPFNKSVRVVYNDRTDPVMLFIKGKINAKETAGNSVPQNVDTTPKINYAVPRGAIAFEKMIENLKDITSDQVKRVDFRIKNTSAKDVKILADKTESDKGVSLKVKDPVLKPGQESVITVVMDGKMLKEAGQPDGYLSKSVVFFTDEAEGARKQVTINANYKRVISADERANSPKISFVETEVKGGKIIEGEKFVYEYKFTNTGKSDLVIASAKASCGCTASTPSKDRIAPGETASITATFNSKGRLGTQSKSITVKSNDIDNPTVVLRFTVEVVKDPFHAGSMMGGSN